jgi:3-oxoacyl-[acyl-carrier protein] reductase
MKKPATAIITGASRGIGKATAQLFAAKGYNVLINYHHSEAAAVGFANRLNSGRMNSAAIFKADVSKKDEVGSMIEFCVEAFGGIDVLINNAGISKQRLFIEISGVEWDEIVNTNLKGVFNCSQAVLRYMLPEKKGKIINITSIWGMVGAACEVHYSAAKAGVIGLTKALAKELGPSNIQVNCIAPGIIQTEMLDSLNQAELDALRLQTPLGKLGSPSDIAACALFLASDSADFLTGQVISPNGGFVI